MSSAPKQVRHDELQGLQVLDIICAKVLESQFAASTQVFTYKLVRGLYCRNLSPPQDKQSVDDVPQVKQVGSHWSQEFEGSFSQ